MVNVMVTKKLSTKQQRNMMERIIITNGGCVMFRVCSYRFLLCVRVVSLCL